MTGTYQSPAVANMYVHGQVIPRICRRHGQPSQALPHCSLERPQGPPSFPIANSWSFSVVAEAQRLELFSQVTDQPRARPDGPLRPTSRQKHVILSLSLPSSAHAKDSEALVSAIFPFIDALSHVNLRPETKTKLKKTRDELEKDLRAESEKEKKEEVR